MNASSIKTFLFGSDPAWRTRLWGTLALFTLLIMEAIGSSLWYQALFEPSETGWGKILLAVFTVMAGSVLLASVMNRRKLRMPVRQGIFIVWLLVAIFVSLKVIIYPHVPISLLELAGRPIRYFFQPDIPEVNFFHLLAIILITWRGVSLARSPISLLDAQLSFQMGLVTLLIYGMIFANVHPLEATLGLYFFLFCGLITMSLARVSNLSELRGGRIPRFGTGWIVSILLAALGVVGLAMLAGWLTSGRIVQILATLLVIFFGVLTAIVLVVLSPLLGYLADLLMRFGDLLMQLLNRLKTITDNKQIQQLIEQLNEGLGKVIPFILAGRGLVLIAVVGMIVLAILVALRMRANRTALVEEAEVEKSEPESNPNRLSSLLRRLLQDFSGLRLGNPGQMLAAARIRQIYRQLMALSQKLGAPRPPHKTPLEFLPQLETLFPAERDELERITGAYVKIRYGELPETSGEVKAVEAAWERIHRAGRQALALRKRQKQA